MIKLDPIMEASDGIVVARNSMSMEIAPEKMFLVQKNMIQRCNEIDKPVICASQMLESMARKPRATRAESSNVATAILDGAECVMLSGKYFEFVQKCKLLTTARLIISDETAKGEYSLECVRTMSSICKEAEAAISHDHLLSRLTHKLMPPMEATHAIATSAVDISIKCFSIAIIVVTRSGRTARLISKYTPRCPIIAVTKSSQVARQCQLYRGILPLFYSSITRSFCSSTVVHEL